MDQYDLLKRRINAGYPDVPSPLMKLASIDFDCDGNGNLTHVQEAYEGYNRKTERILEEGSEVEQKTPLRRCRPTCKRGNSTRSARRAPARRPGNSPRSCRCPAPCNRPPLTRPARPNRSRRR
jgi:hypothetical protein